MQIVITDNTEYLARVQVNGVTKIVLTIAGWLLQDDGRIVPLVFDTNALEMVTLESVRRQYENSTLKV